MSVRLQSEALFAEALKHIPGGVNSPVRGFRAVGGTPFFAASASGARVTDVDGNTYIDYVGTWGPAILGHAALPIIRAIQSTAERGTSFGIPHAQEVTMAQRVKSLVPSVEKVRFCNSGTEATMSAIRLARGYTKRDKILKFEGCYHGHVDSLLVKAGSGLVTFGETSSAGIPKSFAEETIVVPLNDPKAVKEAFKQFKNEIAAIIIEGVPANNGLLIQDKTFVHFLREICTKNKSLLIFDEVITGFRLGFEGAAAYYEVQPDIITYGKIIGGGLPVGAYGASATIMGHISPDGAVYQAGTLSGNPVAMAAGIAQLSELAKSGFYKELNAKTQEFVESIQRYADTHNYAFRVFTVGSIFWFAFTKKDIKTAEAIDPASMDKFKIMHRELLNRGIYMGPSGYEVGFVSAAHTKIDLEKAKRAIFESLDIVFRKK